MNKKIDFIDTNIFKPIKFKQKYIDYLKMNQKYF